MAPKKVAKRPAAKAYKLPDKIAQGQILVDVTRKQWRLGRSVGQGGFGEIYLASDIIDKPVGDHANFVIKVEPHSNGPLFTEMHCYIRIAKPEFIENWKKEKKLKRLGMPKYLGSGSHEYQGQKYRFMVMERFGDDLQKIIERHDKKFSYKTVVQVAIQILDVLEYIHSYEYIHADIKASNLLVGYQPGTQNQVFLVDYGLACRYKIDGKHKEYKYDQRKAHDGTIEFTSRDAHIGAHSRRGDLEILGYNLVQWLCGKLPWEDNLQDCNYVAGKKRALMEDVPNLMNVCFSNKIPPGVQEYMEYVASLTFDEGPNYEKCRNILQDGLKKRGYKEDGKLVFMSATPKPSPSPSLTGRKKAVKRRSEEAENMGETSPKRRLPLAGRSPCKPRNFSSRLNKRLYSKESEVEIGPSKPLWPESVVDADDMVIEKENQKMLERKRQQRPKRILIKKDTSLDNPTPQMLEIMARMREKSISPPICTKRHRHNSTCQHGFRVSPSLDQPPNEFTPAMEEVMKKRSDRRQSSESESSYSHSLSSELFDSEEDFELEEETTENNATVYYSPCGSTSPTVDCANDKHNKLSAAKVPVRNYSSRRVSLSNRRKGSHPRSKPRVEISAPVEMRITRSSSRNSCSPEIF